MDRKKGERYDKKEEDQDTDLTLDQEGHDKVNHKDLNKDLDPGPPATSQTTPPPSPPGREIFCTWEALPLERVGSVRVRVVCGTWITLVVTPVELVGVAV